MNVCDQQKNNFYCLDSQNAGPLLIFAQETCGMKHIMLSKLIVQCIWPILGKLIPAPSCLLYLGGMIRRISQLLESFSLTLSHGAKGRETWTHCLWWTSNMLNFAAFFLSPSTYHQLAMFFSVFSSNLHRFGFCILETLINHTMTILRSSKMGCP